MNLQLGRLAPLPGCLALACSCDVRTGTGLPV